MTKFVDVLVRLPNLRTLNLLDISHRGPVTKGLKRKCAKFPNIREMTICPSYCGFIECCPNLESLTFKDDLMQYTQITISSHGAGLKRVGGVDFMPVLNVECGFSKLTFEPRQKLNVSVVAVVRACPSLQEISLRGSTYVRPPCQRRLRSAHSPQQFYSDDVVKCLRQAKHLSVVEIHLQEGSLHGLWDPHQQRKARKEALIEVLKKSPSKDRKFLRWEVIETSFPDRRVVEAEELEVSSEPSL